MELECTCHFNPENGFRLDVVCPKHDGVFTVPNPRPDFAQFAERCKLANSVWLSGPPQHPTGIGIHVGIAQDYAQAERHARLLETIQKWANSEITFAGYSLNDDEAAVVSKTLTQWQAHIRSLLEQG